MCRNGGSLGSFFSSLLSSVLAAAVEWGKFGQFLSSLLSLVLAAAAEDAFGCFVLVPACFAGIWR